MKRCSPRALVLPRALWKHGAAPVHHVDCDYGGTDALGKGIRYLGGGNGTLLQDVRDLETI